MAKINVDLPFFGASSRAHADPDAAAEALLIIAKRLRSGGELKPDIVEYLAGAIEASMGKPQKQRGAALLRELRLTAGNRRPVIVDEQAVGRQYDELIEDGQSQNSAASQIAANFNISESTATRLWKAHVEYMEVCSQINKEMYDEG